MLTDPQRVQLMAVRSALKLEQAGMRHSRLGKIRKPWAVKLGLPPSTTYEALTAHISAMLST